jgi:hypothetical protein
MWVLFIVTVYVLGGPETSTSLKGFVDEVDCISERDRIWDEMNKTYSGDERSLYRFACVYYPRRTKND